MSTELPPIRVASVPADHPYIRHLGLPGGEDRVTRLSDQRAPGQRGWWPPRMLEPEWVERNHERFDVFHVQFGFDGRHPDQLRELCERLREHGKPLVYTVHDLRNPNHESHQLHQRQLEVLIGAADRLLTLTDCAATAIAARYGRRATVIPHPHVVPLEQLAGRFAGRRHPPRRATLGVHLKSLRSNMVGVALLEALAPLAARPEIRIRVDLHEEVWEPQAAGFRADLRCALEHLQRRGAIDLRIHPYFDDEALYEYLREIEIAVLPYRFGTHSGWLEACRDLGTAVLAPSCGCYADQGRVFTFACDEGGLDGSSLQEAALAARAAIASGEVQPLGAARRRGQRETIAWAHRRLYEGLLESAAPGAAPSRSLAA